MLAAAITKALIPVGDLKPDARPMQIWSSVLKTLIRALASCPYLGPRVVTAQWSDISELCLIAMQGTANNWECLEPLKKGQPFRGAVLSKMEV